MSDARLVRPRCLCAVCRRVFRAYWLMPTDPFMCRACAGEPYLTGILRQTDPESEAVDQPAAPRDGGEAEG